MLCVRKLLFLVARVRSIVVLWIDIRTFTVPDSLLLPRCLLLHSGLFCPVKCSLSLTVMLATRKNPTTNVENPFASREPAPSLHVSPPLRLTSLKQCV